MKKKSFGKAGLSSIKRSLTGKCLAYHGGIFIIRPMIAMLLIVVLLSSATVTKAQQITVSREANKFIQIGAKVLGQIPNPYAKAFGGAVGFLFAEEKLPDYDELKASLEKEWLLDIDDKSKENYKTFINAKKEGWLANLDNIALAETRSSDEAMDQARAFAVNVRGDIPLFHKNKEGKPYPAGPTLPYLYAAMSLYLDLIKMQIEYEQLGINKAAGDAQAIAGPRQRRDALVLQYNKQLVDFWKILQREIVRAKNERGKQVVCAMDENRDQAAWYMYVRDKYYGREDEGYGPNLKHYEKVEIAYDPALDEFVDPVEEKADLTEACNKTLGDAKAQITKETNSYDLLHYGLYRTTMDIRAPILYSCSERIRATRAGLADPVVPSLHLVCPVPGGVVDEEGELASEEAPELRFPFNEAGDITKILTDNWNNYPAKGYRILRNEDPGYEIRGEPDTGSQTVTNTNDSGPGSLRQAIEDGGTINIDAIQGQTITLTSGPLYIYARDVKIMADNLKQPIKIVGQRGDKIFVVSGDAKFYNDHGTNLYNLLDVDGKDLKCGLNPVLNPLKPVKVTTCPGVGQ